MQAVAFEDLTPEGLLRQRMELSAKRLQDAYYHWAEISKVNFVPFPGDAIGRNILGLTLQARVLHRDAPANLKEILARLGELECPDGYLGIALPADRANEDVLAAHNGHLRGLCEHHFWTKDPVTLKRIERIRDNLLLPAKQAIVEYRADDASQSTIKWHLSDGDIGQLFLLLDGATQAYEIAPSAPFAEMLDAMIARYQRLSLIKISAQIHAMLSAANGILRWYELRGNPTHLKFAKALYDQYRKLAVTENYENYNWFNRPEWTEACAVVDSFLLATNLWRLTGEVKYLEDAHHILYNALLPGQLTNGGFGTNPCVGAKAQTAIQKGCEAPFCCSMRGAEGLARAIQFNYFVKDDRAILPFFADSTATLRFKDGVCRIHQMADYPYDGRVRLEILESTVAAPKQFEFFLPPWIKQGSATLKLNGKTVQADKSGGFVRIGLRPKTADVIEYAFEQTAGAADLLAPERMPKHHRYFHGALLLGCASEQPVTLDRGAKLEPAGRGRHRVAGSGTELVPVLELRAPAAPVAVTQLLFLER